MDKVFSWLGTDADRWETARFDPSRDDGLLATGFQAGADPEPYQLSYKLDVRRGFKHSHLTVNAVGNGWHRELFLRRTSDGVWSWRVLHNGECDLPEGGAPESLLAQLQGAEDCDLGFSPLTNLMPVRRYGLHLAEGSRDLVVVWISVPDLALHAAPQRYEHVRMTDTGSVVRFTSLDFDFTADLELDPDGVVAGYPGLARRARRG